MTNKRSLHEAHLLGSPRDPRVGVGDSPTPFFGGDTGIHTRDGYVPREEAVQTRIPMRLPCGGRISRSECDLWAWGKSHAFTLIELLVATAVFSLLVLVLASISNQALSVWSRNEQKSDLREAARTAMNVIGSELRQAVLPVYRADTNSLQLVVNPPGVSAAYNNHDSIFWQAPVATSRSKGDLAVVGYFIRKEGNVSKLCRLFVNPDDPDYAIYSSPEGWVNDALLDAKAPADEASNLQGVFLENVPGMWITTYSDAVTAHSSAYDSRVVQKFPARIEISLALLDKVGAQRVASGQVILPESRNCADLATYLSQLPAGIAEHMQSATIDVPFPF